MPIHFHINKANIDLCSKKLIAMFSPKICMDIKDHGNRFQDMESLRAGMISALDKYLHDFGSQMRAQDIHSLKIQHLLSSADKMKLFKIDEDGPCFVFICFEGENATHEGNDTGAITIRFRYNIS